MSDVQHTPGPWRVKHWRDGRVSIETTDELWNIATLSEGDDDAAGAIDADAALIAAAPDLLAACQAILAEADGGWLRESPVAKQLRAALARASTKPTT